VKQLLQREIPDFITPDLWPPNSPDLNPDELKLRLIEVWFGIQQSVADQAIDQWQVCLNACFKAKGKHFEHMLLMCCSTTVNNLLRNLHYSFSFRNF